MTEVPEHLLAKAKAAREKAAAAKAASDESDAPADAPAAAEEPEEEIKTDEEREAFLGTLKDQLGDAVVDAHVMVGHDVLLRIKNEAWKESIATVKGVAHCQFFDFLSAIDWMPSPYGRQMDSDVDTLVHGAEETEPEVMEQGLTGGDTRFQVLARISSVTHHKNSVIFKADVADDDPRIDSIIDVYPGANWHERETWEMFGIGFNNHPDVRHIYLPGAFEGHPLRKDFPLLARKIKPWPGIVDVEPMPGEEDA